MFPSTTPPPPPQPPYIDIPFNISIALLLLLSYHLTLHAKPLLLTLVALTSTTILLYDKTSTASSLIKLTCELPLGLGSVLIFQTLPYPTQKRYLQPFTTYVNLAVYGNIAMMVLTPTSGTLRGAVARLTCAALSVWIVLQGRRRVPRWETITLHPSIFLFNAVDKEWIFAHAVYRFILLTLPCFSNAPRYRLLELFSLLLTKAFAGAAGTRFEEGFGMADTVVVPVLSGGSALVEMMGVEGKGVGGANEFGWEADLGMSVVVGCVGGFVWYRVWKEFF
ncbi:unnamed protein product [Periconia digitata]|uniref:Uncharacterized protein n=1 Tax=Periconia digitata TaxID=1303443 RepID=A0A9W4UAU6_9PLEO|nr:unnamed protein product [Periconia digitata]